MEIRIHDLLDGLEDAIHPVWLERIWEMIWRRWQAYESVYDQG